MSVRRLFGFKFSLLVSVVTVLLTISATAIQGASGAFATDSACVRLFQQTIEGTNYQITTLDTRTGKSITTTQPTIPPQPWLSPDGKYAAFWQMTPDKQAGLYLASTANRSGKLLYELSPQEVAQFQDAYQPLPFTWAPDGAQFAFIEHKKDQYYLTITSADTTRSSSVQILPPKGQSSVNRVVLLGWSADSKYLAAQTWSDLSLNPGGELRIWSGDNLSTEASGSNMALYPVEHARSYTTAAWSPQGHRLATLLDVKAPPGPGYASDPVQLTIWSPEHGIEGTIVAYVTEYADLHWSPDGRQLDLDTTTGDGPTLSVIYGTDRGVITKNKPEREYRYFAGWAADGRAIVTDLIGDLNADTQNIKYQIALIDANQGSYQAVATDIAWWPQTLALSGGKRIAYLEESGTAYKAKLVDFDGQHTMTFFEGPYGNSEPSVHPQEGALTMNRLATRVELFWFSPAFEIISVKPDGSGLIKTQARDWLDKLHYVDVRQTDNVLELVNSDSGSKQDLLTLKPDQASSYFVGKFSPDKTGIALVSGSDTTFPRADSIILSSLDKSPASTRLISAPQLDLTNRIWRNSLRIFNIYDYEDMNETTWVSYSLAWSPDSSMLAYVIDDNNIQRQMVVVSRDGTERWRVIVPLPPNIPYNPPSAVASLQWVPCAS